MDFIHLLAPLSSNCMSRLLNSALHVHGGCLQVRVNHRRFQTTFLSFYLFVYLYIYLLGRRNLFTHAGGDLRSRPEFMIRFSYFLHEVAEEQKLNPAFLAPKGLTPRRQSGITSSSFLGEHTGGVAVCEIWRTHFRCLHIENLPCW